MSRRRTAGSLVMRSLVLALGCSLLLGARTVGTPEDHAALQVTVRSFVERPRSLFGKKPPRQHGKLYKITAIKLSRAADEANAGVSAVDEAQLQAQLRAELAARGFHEAANDVPDIMLMVFYGRGDMREVYADKSMDAADGSGAPSPPGQPGKALPSTDEKLFVVVNAWDFPGFDPHAKRKLLWRTTVSADASDRNLNQVAAGMFAAAGPYFDRETPEQDVTVASNVPENKTSVGELDSAGSAKAYR